MALPPDDRRPALEPPRFRLRTLLALVAVCCLLLAIITSLNPYGMFAAIMLVLTVLAHILGATLGHKLRDYGSRPPQGEEQRPAAERYRHVEPAEFAPTTRLSGRRGPGRLILIMSITWAVLGAAGGAILLVVVNGERSSIVNIASGAAAFGVLGAIWGFALASFLQELLGALWEAHKLR